MNITESDYTQKTGTHLCWVILPLLVFITHTDSALAQEGQTLKIDPSVRLSADSLDGHVFHIDETEDLKNWHPFIIAHDQLDTFQDPRAFDGGNRFFRLHTSPRASDDDWKHQVQSLNDSFLSPPPQDQKASRWIKFLIELDTPYRVLFQDSTKYPFHFDFASKRIETFQGIHPAEFDQLTLHASDQKAVLGALIFPPTPDINEIGIQFAGNDPFAVDRIIEWFQWVQSSVAAPADTRFLYFPSFEQTAVTQENLSRFQDHRIEVDSPARWLESDQCYSEGWAFGRLVFVPSNEIDAAYTEGRLLHTDILMTDTVPAEIPSVAGVITTTPATPNSHVAILSKSFRIPFVYLAREDARERMRSWDGQEVMLMGETLSNRCLVNTFNLEGRLSEAQRLRLIEAKQTPPLSVTPIKAAGNWSLSTDTLTPDDIPYVGGKAAHLGILRRAIPEHSPTPAIAFTFDLWTAYLDQGLEEGLTLREAIASKLDQYSYPPENVAALKSDLNEIRDWFKNKTDFSTSQKSIIVEALAPFDPHQKIRFRSSTNVEDSDVFVGAGLYDSFSGCLMDDLDADENGPSHCDPTKTKERGVFRALRKVYASFYNDNAYLERLRYEVNEDTVGMAVLVHPSFPDDIELANGVATLRVVSSDNGTTYTLAGSLVSQAGAASIANPDSNALPEVITLEKQMDQEAELHIDQSSSLVPLGDTVMNWEDDYQTLIGLLESATKGYLESKSDHRELLLDFEYKKVATGELVVKQIREIPLPVDANDQAPFVLNNIGRLEVFQHHGKDLFANYRLKSIWDFQALQIEGETLGDAFDFVTRFQYHDGQTIQTFEGSMSDLPESTIAFAGDKLTYTWSLGQEESKNSYTLTFNFPGRINQNNPIALNQAILIELSARYATPKPRLTSTFEPTIEKIRSETTRMIPLDHVIDRTMTRRRQFKVKEITVTTTYELGFFKFPAPGIGIFDGKSFPLVRWSSPTRIEGLTREPFELNNTFSRTYDSNRHNFLEVFLLVPHLDPDVSQETLQQLREQNIQGILVSQWTADSRSSPNIYLWGFDDSLRKQ